MNTALLKKQNIENENNNAQDDLLFSLKNLSSNTRELIIKKSMSGSLDFSVLQEHGLTNIRRISITQKGNVTSISNLPSNLDKFECTNQLLTDVPLLPESLTFLDLNHNQIENIVLKNMKQLKILNLSNNHIDSLEDLPDSIEELYLNNNEIYYLDLVDLVRLRVLHVYNNNLLTLKNVPSNIVDLKVEDGNPNINIMYSNMPETKQIQPRKDFKEALDEYFALKNEYESKKRNLKIMTMQKALEKGVLRKNALKIVQRVVPKCLVCKRNVGMVFERKDGKYIARCGDIAKPCGLKIELIHGSHGEYVPIIGIIKKDMDTTTEKIIIQKMDTLFSYIDEKSALTEFNELLKSYQTDSNLYDDLLNQLNNKTEAEHKHEMIKAKINKIHELKRIMNAQREAYLKSDNGDIIKSMMNIYLKEYMPEIHNLRLLKYAIMESNFTDVNMLHSQLFQQEFSLEKMEYNEEPVEIKKFHLSSEPEASTNDVESVIYEEEWDTRW